MCFGSAVEMSRLMSETEEIHDCIIAGIDTVAADFEHPAGDASWLIAALLAECGQRYRIDPAQTTLYGRSEEHTSELQSLMRISYAVFCLKKKNTTNTLPTQ